MRSGRDLPAGVCDTLYGETRVCLHRTLSEQVVVVFLLQSYLGSLTHGDLTGDKDDEKES